MKFLYLIFFFCASILFAQQVDSTAINKKYDLKQEEIKQKWDERIDYLLKNDPVLNQLRGASNILEELRKKELEEIKNIIKSHKPKENETPKK